MPILTSDTFANGSNESTAHPTLAGPSILAPGARGSLYVISNDLVNEYGYSQGSVHLLTRRRPSDGEVCGEVGCWDPPKVVVRSVSNPRGLAVDESDGMLYVLEQNSLRGYSYETFTGDVLAFCASGRYDCAGAQNSGECDCFAGYGGGCCEIALGGPLTPITAVIRSWAPLLIGIVLLFAFPLASIHAGGHRFPPDPTRSHQIPPDLARSHRISPDPTRNHQKPPDPIRSHQFPPDPTSPSQTLPDSPRSLQIPPSPSQSLQTTPDHSRSL